MEGRRRSRALRFDRIYSGWEGNVIASDAKAAVRRSVVRYQAVEGRLDGMILPWPDRQSAGHGPARLLVGNLDTRVHLKE